MQNNCTCYKYKCKNRRKTFIPMVLKQILKDAINISNQRVDSKKQTSKAYQAKSYTGKHCESGIVSTDVTLRRTKDENFFSRCHPILNTSSVTFCPGVSINLVSASFFCQTVFNLSSKCRSKRS